MIMALMVIMTAACTAQDPVAGFPPPDTYQPHDPIGEDSETRPVPPGTATILTAPLIDFGAYCVQIRSNADGRAIWCRNRDADDPWVAQFLLDAEDRLAWAWIPAPRPAERPDDFDADRLTRFAVAALGAVWPGSSGRIVTELEKYELERRDRAERAVSTEGAFTRGWRDDHADYTVSSLDGLVVAGRDVTVERWPSDALHYGGRMSIAVGDLQESGFDCFYPPQLYCQRGNSEFRVSLRGDRIITADFTIFGGETLADTFPRGLTFLAPEVRPAIATRIEKSRKDRSDFLGTVAGTLIAIDAAPVPPAGGTVPITVRIGAPLTGTFPV
jgi:hypothetical protein